MVETQTLMRDCYKNSLHSSITEHTFRLNIVALFEHPQTNQAEHSLI